MELAEMPKRVQGGSSNASLTHYLRLLVCSYLPLETLVTKIASLNNYERRALHNSAIARGNRSFQICLWQDQWLHPMGKQLPLRIVDMFCSLVSDLEIEVQQCLQDRSDQMLAKLTNLIVNLPPWYDRSSLSLRVIYTNRKEMIDLD